MPLFLQNIYFATHLLFLNKKYKILLNYVVGPIIFIWFSYSIYNQIYNQKDLAQTWQNIKTNFSTTQWIQCFVVFLLMFINWGLETKKWQIQT